MTYAIVVPTVREEQYKKFVEAWQPLIDEYQIELVKVVDSDEPYILYNNKKIGLKEYAGKYADVIYNKTDAVRNFGFAYAHKELQADVIFSLDDDVLPVRDTIKDHIDALSRMYPISWVSSAYQEYVRGFPFGIRNEAECWVSHGMWSGVPDLDAPTQLIRGTAPVGHIKQVIPKGVLFPFCAMNFAFKREATPYIYQAPMGYKVGLDRFADIWGGVEMKKDMDILGKAVVSGYAVVHHERASNVFTNLVKEAKGIGMHEEYGKDPYFKLFKEKRERWQEWIGK